MDAAIRHTAAKAINQFYNLTKRSMRASFFLNAERCANFSLKLYAKFSTKISMQQGLLDWL